MSDKSESGNQLTQALKYVSAAPSLLIRYGILFPLRCVTLGASTVAFFVTLPVAVSLKSSDLVVIHLIDLANRKSTFLIKHSFFLVTCC